MVKEPHCGNCAWIEYRSYEEEVGNSEEYGVCANELSPNDKIAVLDSQKCDYWEKFRSKGSKIESTKERIKTGGKVVYKIKPRDGGAIFDKYGMDIGWTNKHMTWKSALREGGVFYFLTDGKTPRGAFNNFIKALPKDLQHNVTKRYFRVIFDSSDCSEELGLMYQKIQESDNKQPIWCLPDVIGYWFFGKV